MGQAVLLALAVEDILRQMAQPGEGKAEVRQAVGPLHSSWGLDKGRREEMSFGVGRAEGRGGKDWVLTLPCRWRWEVRRRPRPMDGWGCEL